MKSGVLKAFLMRQPRIIAGDCWEWPGAVTAGYGCLRFHQKLFYAHRLAYCNAYGSIPIGAHILHKCDTKLCINPMHLELGDQAKNNRDAWARGLIKPHPLKLSSTIVKKIRTEFGTQKDIATRFGVNQSTISRIRSGKIWR